MNARNCKKCGRVFNYISGMPLCPTCKEEMEEKFQAVKEYIQNNKDTTIKTVAEECEVDEGQIRQKAAPQAQKKDRENPRMRFLDNR